MLSRSDPSLQALPAFDHLIVGAGFAGAGCPGDEGCLIAATRMPERLVLHGPGAHEVA